MVSWQALEAISSVAGTVVLVTASWIALRQWKESLSNRQVQGALALIEQFQEGSTRETREFLLRHREEILRVRSDSSSIEKLDKLIKRKSGDGDPRSLVELRKNLAVLEFVAILCLNDQLPLAETAGIQIARAHPHMLRHTYVTTMLDAGADLRDVQIAARHADPRTTMRYDRARNSLDRHPNYILAAYMASGT